MKSLFTKQALAIIAAVSMTIAIGTAAYAGSAIKQIQAQQNTELKISVDGKNIALKLDGEDVPAIVYDGRTYIPARVLVEAMGGSVKWDSSTQTVRVSTGSNMDGIPYKDNTPEKNNTPAKETPAPNKGSSTENSTSSGKLQTTFPKGTSAETIHSKIKGPAVEFLTLYLNALKSGDTTDTIKWVKANYVPSKDAYRSQEMVILDIEDTVDYYRSNYTMAELNPVVNDALSNLKNGNWNKHTGAEEGTTLIFSNFYISGESSDYTATFGVFFSFNQNDNGDYQIYSLSFK